MMELGALGVHFVSLLFTVSMWISGFSFGATSFGDLGSLISFLFTGS
ncbi:hypothetical protein VPHD479_0368 [Vibrio phage D479]